MNQPSKTILVFYDPSFPKTGADLSQDVLKTLQSGCRLVCADELAHALEETEGALW
ncbi:hypothetical protein P7H25_18100 [Paenibacillus larvae]|nr:hypothetical protein [Paenibacillus larvae]MDT2257090.1 hypothetical protein [Paenibacillus larvae]